MPKYNLQGTIAEILITRNDTKIQLILVTGNNTKTPVTGNNAKQQLTGTIPNY